MKADNYEYGITSDKGSKQDTADYNIQGFLAEELENINNGDYDFLSNLENSANLGIPHAELAYGSCLLHGFGGVTINLDKAEYFLQQAAMHEQHIAFVELHKLELKRGNIHKSIDWLVNGMNKGYLPVIKALIKFLGESEQRDDFLYYEALSKYITMETDRFETYNANTTRDQVLASIQEEIAEFCKNPYNESSYESRLNSLLQLDLPGEHKEIISKALDDYHKVMKKMDQSAKKTGLYRIARRVLPAFISLLYYKKFPGYNLDFLIFILWWSLPIAVIGIIQEVKKQNDEPWYGALWALAFGAVCFIMYIFRIGNIFALAVVQFIIMQIQLSKNTIFHELFR
ncbi:MAG: hypothetical protein GX375_07475 [Clostridiales bacterium]|nr:hypothetical protein [Clostridiales bacterium]